MKIVVTYGTFDFGHYGHYRLLKRASELGDKLVVYVSTDEFNNVKGKKCIIPYEERVEYVSSFKFVDEIYPETSWSQKHTDIYDLKQNPNDELILVMGKDWEGIFDNIGYDKCVYLDRTKHISTSLIKEAIKNDSK